MTSDPLPLNLLRLSFQTHQEFADWSESNRKMLTHIWRWQEEMGNRQEPFELPGVCDLCERMTTYTAVPRAVKDSAPPAFRTEWWDGTRCGCGMSNRDRAALRVFQDGYQSGDRIYHVGCFSSFRKWLSRRIPKVMASQYEEGRRPGEIANGVRYEDLTRLSFRKPRFDTIVCMEILEHIPDYKAALREMARTLRPAGRAILTVPWLGRDTYEHLVRAEIDESGEIRHVLPPEYHGDPASKKGILSFRSFGWKLLEELREAGFSTARAEFVFGPVHGYMKLLAPVIVGVR
jgi:SAM-dependent methyltransferase